MATSATVAATAAIVCGRLRLLTTAGSSLRAIAGHVGLYQTGEVHARSWCFIGTSGDIFTPKRSWS
jgi:hypothetical protein